MNLPVQLTSFVGRDREMGEVAALLDQARLVTLTGAGGAGKARLALQVAAEGVGSHIGEAWLGDLAPVGEPGRLWGRGGGGLGGWRGPGPRVPRSLPARPAARP